jgi:hypothetical protein
MEWKPFAFVLGICLFGLAIIGLIVHSDMRLVGADLLGAVAAIAIVLLANRGRVAQVGMLILTAVVLLVMALMAVTSHRSPVLTALTLAFAFAFAFVSWTALSGGPSAGATRRPPRTA